LYHLALTTHDTPTASRVTPLDIVSSKSTTDISAVTSTLTPTAAPTGTAARRRRQLAVTRKESAEGMESSGVAAASGCDGSLPLFIETQDAEAVIAALQAVIDGATPLADGGTALDPSLLCDMKYKTSYVYEIVRAYSVDDDSLPLPAAASDAPPASLWGAVGGVVGAVVAVAVLALVGVTRRLFARNDDSDEIGA
jgi:hypothetical protein